MTREEAIKTLKDNYCAMCAYGSQNMDSCDIRSCDNKDAIKALEQEPKTDAWSIKDVANTLAKHGLIEEQEPCEDAISRQAVLEMAFDMSEIDGEHFTYPYMVVDVEDIQKLPSVNPQRTGHWIRDTITDIYHCSECRSICHQDPKSKDDYCRYCGARMDEPQESEGQE